jgi:glycosyltransferase involved in cell wall biosynthesis
MEAMSMELPVIATRVGGVTGLVRQGVDGLLVEAQRPQQIAEAVRCVVADGQLARQLGAMGRQRVEAHFSSRISAQELVRRITVPTSIGPQQGASIASKSGIA